MSPSLTFLDANSKGILNGINNRLNDIDMKLGILFELLAPRLNEHGGGAQPISALIHSLNKVNGHSKTEPDSAIVNIFNSFLQVRNIKQEDFFFKKNPFLLNLCYFKAY